MIRYFDSSSGEETGVVWVIAKTILNPLRLPSIYYLYLLEYSKTVPGLGDGNNNIHYYRYISVYMMYGMKNAGTKFYRYEDSRILYEHFEVRRGVIYFLSAQGHVPSCCFVITVYVQSTPSQASASVGAFGSVVLCSG